MVAPSAVVGRDYQLTILTTVDGRVVQGIVTNQTASTITLQTLEQPVTLRMAEIDDRTHSPLSMMPDGLLDPLSERDVHDLINYLACPTQVPMKGPDRESAPSQGIQWEAELLVTVNLSGGQLQSQAMTGFPADRWSGDHHLWWTGAKPGDSLDFEFSAPQSGLYALELILTRAPDYGAVELLLDGQPLGDHPIVDLYAPVVVTSGVVRFDPQRLEAGKHTLTMRLVGKNPQAAEAYMVGVDVVRLVPLAE
jgi:hypothetical protein